MGMGMGMGMGTASPVLSSIYAYRESQRARCELSDRRVRASI